jgi:hypothetical protein
MPFEVPRVEAREEAGRAHIGVFSFHADAEDIVVDRDFEYLRETVFMDD